MRKIASEALDPDSAMEKRRSREGERQAVGLIDPRSLRRATMHSVLGPSHRGGGRTKGFRVIPFAEVEELLNDEEACRQIGTVLVNMGATPITDPAFRREIALLQEKHAEIAVIAISDRDEPQMLREAYALGLRGYIPTSLDIPVFLQALRLVMAGGSFFPAETMLETTPAPDLESGSVDSQEGDPGGNQQHGTFTPRQWEVLRLLREGKPNKDIADALSMCESTVKVHVRQIMKKLDAENRTHAAFLASKIFQTAGERTSKAGEEQ